MLPRALVAVALASLAAGCTGRAIEATPAASGEAAAPERAMDWSPGNWWAYHATIEGKSFDVAIIVHEATADGFRLGTNLSSGFFGLPWSGNVSAARNPTIGAEEWKLFEFPLHDGQEWSYRMLGYDAKTRVRAADVILPDATSAPGFRLESTSYGQLFARYEYAEVAGWFTSLQLIEPTDGHTVLEAKLTAFGPDWSAAYFVERTLREVRIEYPALPGELQIHIPAGYQAVRVNLLVQSATGIVSADLRDENGRPVASASVLGRGVDTDRASARPEGPATWTLRHRGAGTAIVALEITGVALSGPLADAQSTRPEYPHVGHVIDVPPLALGA